ncbi:hypothetical protein M408DRAFT_327171, partial [Serendipita vermifera MAFF 305830]
MPSKQLMAVWGLLDFLMLAAGGGMIALAVILRAPDAIRALVLTDFDLNFGLVLGVMYVVGFVVSVGAIIQRNHVTIGLAILNWFLILNSVVTIVFGSNLWFMTLQEEQNFGNVWNATTAERRIAVQDQLQCCGFANNTAVEVGGFCADPTRAADNGCDIKFTTIADTMLMDAFTTVYALTGILLMLFLATMCVIKK